MPQRPTNRPDMSDQPSASGDSVDLQNTTSSQGSDAPKRDTQAQSEPSSENLKHPRPRRKGWFGRDKRQSVAFYGDYYR